jgi:hypothetical protein
MTWTREEGRKVALATRQTVFRPDQRFIPACRGAPPEVEQVFG